MIQDTKLQALVRKVVFGPYKLNYFDAAAVATIAAVIAQGHFLAGIGLALGLAIAVGAAGYWLHK